MEGLFMVGSTLLGGWLIYLFLTRRSRRAKRLAPRPTGLEQRVGQLEAFADDVNQGLAVEVGQLKERVTFLEGLLLGRNDRVS